ncbi:hypothetical protein J437_LFUL015587 [Ladona fulva]|uniref:Uncharacterized protein n=1 Tax=Ladona fulva TaxID=123851 RepID=A0A8K0K769_LADFU|nr:hypothetical protein J437_LFUL015587 [Ladona fulva]
MDISAQLEKYLNFLQRAMFPRFFMTFRRHLKEVLQIVRWHWEDPFNRIRHSASASLQIRLRSFASRSIGIVPAITSTAASETVRYEQATLRAPLLCTTVMRFLYFAVFRALAHISAPYRSCDSTTAINSFLLHCVGPPTFAISLLNDTVVAAALSEDFLI